MSAPCLDRARAALTMAAQSHLPCAPVPMSRPGLPPLFAPLLMLATAAASAQATLPVGKPIVYCSEASPEGFDPGLWDSTSTNNAVRQMFQGLLGFERGGTALVPRLAERWTVSQDARVFTFSLRRGVRFHSRAWFTPSREFNADDVLFTFGRFLDPSHPFNKALPGNFIYPNNLGLAKLVQQLEKLDDHTVRFTLREPNVVFLSWFAMPFAGIHSAEYAAQLLQRGEPHKLNNAPIGTGPFAFRSYAKDDVLRLEANPGYWAGRVRTPKLIFAIAREPNVRIQKLLAGECQVSAPARDIDVPVLTKRADIQLLQVQALNISYLSFNLARAPTNIRAVREALDIAIDRPALFKVLFPRGDATPATSAFPPAIPGFDTTLRNEYDPERARRLLAEAGFPQGFALDLWALPIARPTNPNGLLLAQMIQQDWARIGVRASIKTYEWGEYLKRANKGEHDVYMSGWSGESGDADEFLTPNLSCAANRSGVKFCNAEFERLIDTARATPDAARRSALYVQAQQIFKRERPWIPFAHSTLYLPVRADVKGFVINPNGGVEFEKVWRE